MRDRSAAILERRQECGVTAASIVLSNFGISPLQAGKNNLSALCHEMESKALVSCPDYCLHI